MDDTLLQVCYISRRADGVSDDDVVTHIVLPAMLRNRWQDITGCLWFDEDHFLQVLEGPAVETSSMMDRILTDDRHLEVDVVSEHAVRRRHFARFSMRMLHTARPASVAELVESRAKPSEPRNASIGDTRGLLSRVVDELARWPLMPAT
ncbi:MAG: BLUF domain-containing protein [Planctomycetota bacterium]